MLEHTDTPFTCATALDQVQRRDFTAWRGFSQTCTLTDVIKQFPRISSGESRGRIGQKEAYFTPLRAEAYSDALRVWFVGEQVLVLNANVTDLTPDLPNVLKALGAPAAALDYRWGTLDIEHGELVYPERGITLFVDSEHQSWFHVAVFASTTFEEYQTSLRLDLGTRRVPMARR